MRPNRTILQKTKTTMILLISTWLLYVPNAIAAGGEMPSLVHDIGISLLTAGVLAILFTRLKIPSIAAFLVAGILIGPIGLKQVTDPVNIDTIAQLGFILLLFLIGLARLEARPIATLCLDAQERWELRQRQLGDAR